MIYWETERLVLRRPRPEDYGPLLESWSDPEAALYTPERPDLPGFIAALIEDMQAKEPGETEPGGPWYQLVAERRSDGAIVADVGIGFGIPGERQVELGYRVHPRHRRRGYGREAVAGAIDYFVQRHAIHRFVAVAASANAASIALLRSLGFRHEGLFRKSFLRRGEWLDDDYFALLDEEWTAMSKCNTSSRRPNPS